MITVPNKRCEKRGFPIIIELHMIISTQAIINLQLFQVALSPDNQRRLRDIATQAHKETMGKQTSPTDYFQRNRKECFCAPFQHFKNIRGDEDHTTDSILTRCMYRVFGGLDHLYFQIAMRVVNPRNTGQSDNYVVSSNSIFCGGLEESKTSIKS